jgi:isochorismate pyruvate lyase
MFLAPEGSIGSDYVEPALCQSMTDVRIGVDALDRQLVALLAERQKFMDAASRIKTLRSAVRDEARIEDVIQKVRAAATDCGLSLDIAEPLWRLLIDCCIAYELQKWDQARQNQPE